MLTAMALATLLANVPPDIAALYGYASALSSYTDKGMFPAIKTLPSYDKVHEECAGEIPTAEVRIKACFNHKTFTIVVVDQPTPAFLFHNPSYGWEGGIDNELNADEIDVWFWYENIKRQGFIVHELVHALQYAHMPWMFEEMTCDLSNLIELQAYAVQDKYLNQYGISIGTAYMQDCSLLNTYQLIEE